MANPEVNSSKKTLHNTEFKLGKTQVNVSLTEQGLSWSGSGKGKSGSVDWRDVLAVKAATERNKSSELCLSYIAKPSNHWKKAVLKFTAADAPSASSWAQKMEELIKEKAIERPKKLYVVVNPKSGSNHGLQIYECRAAPLFKLANIETEVLVTERGGHALETLSLLDLSQYDGVVSVGGDGTYTEVLNGIELNRLKAAGKELSDPNLNLLDIGIRVGIIPAGTGQGMILVATGSKSPETAALNIIYGHSIESDMFSVHNGPRHVYNGCLMVGCGLFSKMIAVSEANRQLGRLRYGYSLIKAMIDWEPVECEVEALPVADPTEGDMGESQGWIKRSGKYLSVSHFMFDTTFNCTKLGRLYLGLCKPTGRFKFMKFMANMQRMQPIELPEWAENIPCSTYKFRQIPPDESPDVGAASGAGTFSPLNVVNIDGDPFNIDPAEVLVRIHPNVVKMFGYRQHALGLTPMDERAAGKTD